MAFEQRLGFGKGHAGANAGGDGGPRAVAHLLPGTPAARRGWRAQYHRPPFKLGLHKADALQGPVGEPQTQHPFHR
jgi:hypothetical protein